MFLALAGGFLTIAPPGKRSVAIFYVKLVFLNF